MGEWVGRVVFSPDVEEKLQSKHRVDAYLVRQATEAGAHDWARWHNHPVYGRRLIICGRAQERKIIAYLRPLDRGDGTWECLTAWEID